MHQFATWKNLDWCLSVEIIPEESVFSWLDAAKSYEKTVASETVLDKLTRAAYWQRIGLCYDYASRQSTTVEDFEKLRATSVEAYSKAAELFGDKNKGLSAQCLANAEYIRSWLSPDLPTKLKSLEKCRLFAKDAMIEFEENDILEFGKTANLLSKCLFERLYVSSSDLEIREVSAEAISNAELAISVLSKTDVKDELVVAFSLASVQCWYIANTSEQEDQRKEISNKSVANAENASKLLDGVVDPYTKALALWANVLSTLYFTDNLESALQSAREMFDIASNVRDNFLKGVSCYLLAHVKDWKVLGEANPNKRRQEYEEIIRDAEKGTHLLQLVGQDALTADTYLFLVQTYSAIASDFAVNLSEKMLFSNRAIDVGKKGLEHAIRSGAPEALISTFHGLSKAYQFHARLEPKVDNKPEFLKNALGFRKEFISIAKNAFHSNLWILGVGLVYAAQIETELSRIEKNSETKAGILEDALADMQEGVASCKAWIASRPVPSTLTSVAGFEESFGDILVDGYSLTGEVENLKKANEAYNDAAEDFKRVDLPTRVAESYWKIARNFDSVEDYETAAKNFENAFAAYKASAQRIAQFSDFFSDYASYMKAWSEIEIAKCSHSDENYEAAVSHYDKASQLLRQSKSWMYLSLNFNSWSILEQAEHFSRNEESKESAEAFDRAIKAFQESKRILTVKLEGLDKVDERHLVASLIKASSVREEYSRGRIAIEEAKILDRQGNHVASSEKYSSAAAVFQKIARSESKQAGKEAKPLEYLCRAWQKMTLAEAKGSPIMYEEAAELFRLANEYMSKESASQMALGHSSFCKALEAGTEYEITRSMSMYEEAIRHLETAANYYLKAGFQTSSDYAKATQRLLNAYVFMENAKRETDPNKQAKYYSMAEKVLGIAAEYFMKANYQDKNEQAQRLIKKVKEERELALSLGEIFHASSITSSTASFSSLSASEERAVGLERFEQGDIQAKIVQHEIDVKVGNNVAIEIQLMNMGREPLSLTRIENLAPTGFQIVAKPDYCQFENMQLIMKGKRLEPLKTEEIMFTLKPFKMGSTKVEPRIICVDTVGRQVLNIPESVTFNVLAAALPGRMQTGFIDLDNLLLGGIPETYAVVLASPSIDERELLVKKFLETGAKNGQITYYISSEVGNIADLVEEHQSNFFFFLCNPRADVMVKSFPNVYKLKGVESLTDIEIALLKSFRTLDPSKTGPRRACITVLSDVLLQHHAVITRKWLSGLLPDLKSKGFTTLIVINPQMHPAEEFQAILGLFEGEIRITEKETNIGLEKTLRVRKLYNQRYFENEIVVSREKLES